MPLTTERNASRLRSNGQANIKIYLFFPLLLSIFQGDYASSVHITLLKKKFMYIYTHMCVYMCIYIYIYMYWFQHTQASSHSIPVLLSCVAKSFHGRVTSVLPVNSPDDGPQPVSVRWFCYYIRQQHVPPLQHLWRGLLPVTPTF